MKFFVASILLFGLGCGSVAFAAELPIRWSVIIYSAIDEEEIASFTDPAVKQLLEMSLPADVELLIQNDTFAPAGVTRSIRLFAIVPVAQLDCWLSNRQFLFSMHNQR